MNNNFSKEDIVKLAAEIGARTALDKLRREKSQETQKQKDKRYKNTKLLLENYRDFKAYSKNAVYTVEQTSDSIKALESIWDLSNRGEIVVDSIKRNAIRTNVIMAHIDAMLEVYKKMCEASQDPTEMRRYNTLISRYIAEKPMTCKDIADINHYEVRTVFRDLEYAVNKMERLIFGLYNNI